MEIKKNRLQLKKMTIAGYKSISLDKPLTIEFGAITVLLGANGSGKSNVISFFKMLNFMMSGHLQAFVEKGGTSQVFLHNGVKCTKEIIGKLYFESDTQTDEYDFNLTSAMSDKLIITKEELSWGYKSKDKQKITILSEFRESGLCNAKDQTSQMVHRILSNCKVFQFHDSSDSSPLRQSAKAEFAYYLQSEGNNLAPFLLRLKNEYNAYYQKIVSYIQLIMPQFKDFYLEPNHQGYVALNWEDNSPNDYIMFPHQLSDGTIRFIALATLLLQPHQIMPKVIIIDEPELGLHPFAINQLGQMIQEASLHAQIVIATQSSDLINEFECENITIIERDDEGGCTVGIVGIKSYFYDVFAKSLTR